MSEQRLLSDALGRHARCSPGAVALEDGDGRRVSYGELRRQVEDRIETLRSTGVRSVGLLADNGIDWILTDLAALFAKIAIVPLPLFFSDGQLTHALRVAQVDAVLTDDPLRLEKLLEESTALPDVGRLAARRPPWGLQEREARFDKLTFTSGTTGRPKGVCLSHEAMLRVAASLVSTSGSSSSDVHLCLTPLSILLENLSGVYGGLIAGARVIAPKLAQVGLTGSSGLDAAGMHAALHRFSATSAITMPEILDRLVAELEAGAAPLRGLRFVGVGGAHVATELLARAHRAGVPAYEGYGLSECSSVVALNTPGRQRDGSVGRVLPHATVRIAEDGEVLVSSAGLCSGYLTDEGQLDCDLDGNRFLRTGDIGALDEDGFLYIKGRKTNRIITSFGRNLSPEWIEAELRGHSRVRQAAVFGESQPAIRAVLVCEPGDPEPIRRHVESVNRSLPDYARVAGWTFASEPFTFANAQLTPAGEPLRDELARVYGDLVGAGARTPTPLKPRARDELF